jgi:hypothetical protein
MKKSVVTIYMDAKHRIGQTIQASIVGLDRTGRDVNVRW